MRRLGLRDLWRDLTVMCFPDGVYKAGFAGSQEAYHTAVTSLFNSLDRLETMLADKRYLVGDTLTEADIRLFVTIVRALIVLRDVISPSHPPGRFVSIPCTSVISNAT